MYKVIISDDEETTRSAFKLMICNHFPELEVIAEAETGREAIELACEHKPHIMIMDVRMPGIDGLQAIAEIKQQNPEIRFIVVSAYDHFKYANEAIRLGVDDYILKPPKRKDIINVINKVIHAIESDKKKRDRLLDLEEKINSLIPMLENEFAYALIFGDIEKIRNINYPSLLGINFEAGISMIACFNKSSYPDNIRNELGKNYMNHKVLELIKVFFDEQEIPCIVSPMISGKINIFIAKNAGEDAYAARLWSIDIAKDLLKKIQLSTNVKCIIGIGEYHECIDGLLTSYNEALTSLSHSVEPGGIVHFGDIKGAHVQQRKYPIHLERVLCDKLRTGDVKESLDAFNEFFSVISEEEIPRLQSYISELMVVISRVIYEFENEDSALYTFDLNEREKLYKLSSHQEILNWSISKIRLIAETVDNIKKKHADSIIAKAIEFINENYTKDINLADVSKYVAVSPYYLSKLFKSERDKNFIEYLTDLRIEAAKKMLMDSEMSAKEVCYAVGYSDPSYFSKVFRKITGLTPVEFREGYK
ncbi:MAG TPA: response regulator [Clostridiaceae bacterium]|nr:response regulator [Clostridiaceae bacterium]